MTPPTGLSDSRFVIFHTIVLVAEDRRDSLMQIGVSHVDVITDPVPDPGRSYDVALMAVLPQHLATVGPGAALRAKIATFILIADDSDDAPDDNSGPFVLMQPFRTADVVACWFWRA